MFKKILFCTDFSENSYWAFTYALNLAKNYNSKLFILHVTPVPNHPEQLSTKVAYLKQVKELKSKQESVKRRVRELRASGDEAWEDFKGEVEEATKDLKAALKRAASRFKKS